MNTTEIAFLSVKGGSGKSTLVSSFLLWLKQNGKMTYTFDACLNNPVIEHFFELKINDTFDYTGSSIASIDTDTCIHCDECKVHCTFNAIENKEQYFVKNDVCTGCNYCVSLCPVEAINMIPKRTGQWKISESEYGEIIHGWASKDSTKLIPIMKKEAIFRANKDECDYLLINAPAGLSLDSKISADQAEIKIVIIDSNIRAKEYLRSLENFIIDNHFNVQIILNNTELNPDVDDKVRAIIQSMKIPIAGEIPFSREIAKYNSLGVICYSKVCDIDNIFEPIFKKITTI